MEKKKQKNKEQKMERNRKRKRKVGSHKIAGRLMPEWKMLADGKRCTM